MINGHISQFIEEYLSRNRRLSAASRAKTRVVFRHLVECFGDILIDSLVAADAEDFQDYLIEKLGSRNSVNSYIKTIAPRFAWAVRHEWIAKNPFVELRPLKVTPNPVRTYSWAELQAILDSATDMWRARILAGATAGLRRGEVLNLTRDDILDEAILVQPKKDTVDTWAWEAKDFEIRTVPLHPKLHNLLVSSIIPALPTNQPYLFLSEKRYWTLRQRIGNLPERIRKCPDENFSKPFQRIVQRAQIKDGCFHDLRRTAITAWHRKLPIRDVMKLAGHSDIKTTLHYLGFSEDTLELAVQATAA